MAEVLSLDDKLEKHLMMFQIEKVAKALVPLAKEAIEAVDKGDMDAQIVLPNFVTAIGRDDLQDYHSVPAQQIISWLQLQDFLNLENLQKMVDANKHGPQG